ncbi:MAG: DUF1330 domain-containing protein [Rhodocyclaceae bacterium]|nr:DUF1330 domain-containing protein [Rhodocyclaceae bacterium]
MTKSAYLVVDAKSHAPAMMAEYRRLAQLAVEKFGGRYLLRGGAYEVVEGDWRPERLVIVEFPSLEMAKTFYASPEYVAARKSREGVSDFDMLLAEAY